MKFKIVKYKSKKTFNKHPKCLGYFTYYSGIEFECGYNTKISCDECKYGFGKKNPEAKCNAF